MTKTLLLFLLSVPLFSCGEKKVKMEIVNKEVSNHQAIEIKVENLTPTVDIEKYILIKAPNENRKMDAEQILKLKRNWPLVMQSPNRVGFDTILSQNFTFNGDGLLFSREDYIVDRIKPSDWKITFVKYGNLTIQFFGDIALLTYRNEVTNENIRTKEIEVEYISWADIYVIENNKWKIGAAHVVDFKMEKK